MSSREYGCFFCSGKSSDPDANCPVCGRRINISPELLNRAIEHYQPEEILGRGFYGWTIKASASYQTFALKVVPAHRVLQRDMTDTEARALAGCSPHRNIARFWQRLLTKIEADGRDVPVYVLVFEFIEGSQTLRKFLSDATPLLSRRDVVDILAGIASGLARMHSKNLWHDDLHDDNVLVRPVAPDENLRERFEAKLIDFGSARTIVDDQPERGERGDYHYLAKHIYAVASAFEFGVLERLTAADRAFVGRLRRLAQRISEPNTSRRDITPAGVIVELGRAYDESAKGSDFPTFAEMKNQGTVSLTEPLANTNALNLTPQDIALLFRDSLG